MGQKLYRGRRSVFRKQNPVLRVILSILGAVAIIAVGFFGAKYITEHPAGSPTVSDQVQTTKPTAKPTTTTTTVAPDATPDPVKQLRGFYLPHSALSVDSLTDSGLLENAKKAGFNAVIFDLKDDKGNLYYQFSSPKAKTVNSYVDNALTKEQLTALFDLIKKAGLTPVPRLHAFQDNLGAKALPEARIGLKENPSWSWYEGGNSNKRWLNPYDNDAHDYVSGLALELKELGAGAVMLDSIQFPNLDGSATVGTDNGDLKPDEALALFLSKTKSLLGEDCPVVMVCTGESVLDNATQAYYNNPLTFAPTIAAPSLNPASMSKTMEEAISHLNARIQVMSENERPALAPMLNIQSLSADLAKQAMADCIAGGVDSYILYHPNGQYDFDAY